MKVTICIGSSCHLKGSYQVIASLKELIAKHNLADQVQLNGSFCLGHCQDGVSAKIDGEIVTGLSPENIEEVFEQKVLSKLKG